MNDGYPFDLTQVAQLLGKLGEIRANGFGAAQRRERLARVISEVTGAPLDAAASLLDSDANWLLEHDCPDSPTVRPEEVEELTPRQRQILARLLAGLEPRLIASELGLTPHTVNTYLAGLYRRLNVANRIALMARFVQVPDWLE